MTSRGPGCGLLRRIPNPSSVHRASPGCFSIQATEPWGGRRLTVRRGSPRTLLTAIRQPSLQGHSQSRGSDAFRAFAWYPPGGEPCGPGGDPLLQARRRRDRQMQPCNFIARFNARVRSDGFVPTGRQTAATAVISTRRLGSARRASTPARAGGGLACAIQAS